MASVRTFELPHYHVYPVHVALFRDVANASHLRRQLLDANPNFDYAFLDASMVISPQHLLSAAFMAIHNFVTSRAKTRTPHSELVFRLSPNNNIGESYKKFGISDDSTTIIAVKLPLSASAPDGTYAKDESITNQTVSAHLGTVVQGTSVEIGDDGQELGAACQLDKVRKVYKLNSADGGAKPTNGLNGHGGNHGNDIEDQKKHIESLVLGIMALKGS
jgi:EKC/KEOPS complex subunit CGI121/TPRKB